jgi:hypothetical protein
MTSTLFLLPANFGAPLEQRQPETRVRVANITEPFGCEPYGQDKDRVGKEFPRRSRRLPAGNVGAPVR